MRSNYTLKQAVITALIMLAIGTQNQALALGLGNIEVKSHLGQPLRASIKIQGAAELKNEACFRVINDYSAENQLANVDFKLSKAVDDVAILTVTTSHAINEPIVNLSVIAECDASMRRDYVLLLDPLLTAEAESPTAEAAVTTDDKDGSKTTSSKTNSTAGTAAQKQTVNAPVTSSKKSSVKRQKNSKSANKNIVLTAGYPVEKPAETIAAGAENNTSKENKPRLSISGDASNVNLDGAQLRLDRELHFTADTASLTLAAEVEIQDEITVMSNRLAHLKQQIDTLAQANLKLKSENQLKAQQLNEANALNNKLDFIGYILGGGLLMAGVNIADKWRRRRQIQQLENAQLAWVNNSKATTNFGSLEAFDTNDDFFELETRQELKNTADKSAEIADASEATKDSEVSFTVEEFNADHNVLDHADVFLSHGRTSLAIQLLQNHLLDFPKQSVTIWMYLLDLLAKENLQALYEQTALECKEHFNIKIADFSRCEDESNSTLESYPRITSGLQQFWGKPAALTYLDDLIYNSRLEVRVGFHKNVIEELLLLRSVAQEELRTAEVIQMDEKKLAMKELKEAQLAAKKEAKLKQIDEIAIKETEKLALEEKVTPLERFEFNLVEYK